MHPYAEIAQTLTESLRLKQPAIAISFSDRLPEGVARWSGPIPAGCRFWQEAASRVFATTSADHERCAVGQYTHGLEMSSAAQTDLHQALKVFADLTYVRPEDVAEIPVLQSRAPYVVYAPLASAPLPPDVVLLFVQANQTRSEEH